MTQQGILFDLDGTILDTAPDLLFTLNQIRKAYGFQPMPIEEAHLMISQGSRGFIKKTWGIDENHPEFDKMRESFLSLYEKHLTDQTKLFPGVEKVLNFLDDKKIPWGIVTNKLTRHTVPLLKALNLHHRPGCIICGDTLKTYKPDPAPVIHACESIKIDPESSLFVGDAKIDVLAGKAAGLRAIVAMYGYIGGENPLSWNADAYIEKPDEIIDWFI